MNQSRCKKGGERGQNKGRTLWNLYRASGRRASRSPEPEWPHGKKDHGSPGLSSPGWLCSPAASDQPPTAKNLIRCHNYIQWCSAACSPVSPLVGLSPCPMNSDRRSLSRSACKVCSEDSPYSPSPITQRNRLCKHCRDTREARPAKIREPKAIPRRAKHRLSPSAQNNKRILYSDVFCEFSRIV